MSESIRLTFSYQGEEITLNKASRLKMRAPAGSPDSTKPLAENLVGQWVEIRNREEQPIYRRFVNRFTPTDVEVPTGNPQAPLRRVPTEIGEGIFHILIPVIKGAKEVVLLEQQIRKNERPRRCDRFKLDLEQIEYSNLNNSEVR